LKPGLRVGAGEGDMRNSRSYCRNLALALALTALAACSANNGGEPMKEAAGRIVRMARGGGRWFPGRKPELDAMVRGFLDDAKVAAIEGRIVAAIAPHAGYVYSGKVAGCTFRAVQDQAKAGIRPETVVVIGFSHRGAYPGVALLDGDAIQTPLGESELDKDAGKELTEASRRIYFNRSPHDGEHSAENEIPFVQMALPGSRLVVALMGDHEPETVNDLVEGLKRLAGKKKILVVASTDLLHDPDYDLVGRTDKTTLGKVTAMDYAGLLRSWSYDRQVCCGIGPVVTAMRFAESQGCKQGTLLCYRNSGDDYPESRGSWVVGYGAVVFALSRAP
jgi:MEMO1 family protein